MPTPAEPPSGATSLETDAVKISRHQYRLTLHTTAVQNNLVFQFRHNHINYLSPLSLNFRLSLFEDVDQDREVGMIENHGGTWRVLNLKQVHAIMIIKSFFG